MKIKKVFVANRGEIAVRILKACRELGLKTVQAFSDIDAQSLPVQLADSAINIGASPALQSYLNIQNVLTAALESGADAVHPGYGFLSENADFAKAVRESGLIFVGPESETIQLMGDKARAREIANTAGIPTIPGSQRKFSNAQDGLNAAEEIGFPCLIKAAAGGGGRGIRVVDNSRDFEGLFTKASEEAMVAFGDGGLYIEKLLEDTRHIEVQIVGDGTRYIHCFDRECSLQRRRQKIWEEAPAFDVDSIVREQMLVQSVSLARHLGYTGLGTVEFLYDPNSREYYFIEMNTRLQVEHPVTESITGIDLVQESLKIAGGEALAYKQEEVALTGHSIECRINAEDPDRRFLPRPGTVTEIEVPDSPNVRFDSFLFPGYKIPPYYDSLIGKLIVTGSSREKCLEILRDTLFLTQIKGIPTTLTLHRRLVEDPDIMSGCFNIDFLERWIEKTNLEGGGI